MNPLQIYVGDDGTDADFDDKMYFVFTLRYLSGLFHIGRVFFVVLKGEKIR